MSRRVLLTGATGTIGSAIVPRLLDEAGTRVTLLIRASDDADLQRRLDAMHDWWGHANADGRRERVRALRGDITEPGFGLGAETTAALVATTSHLIHCAASVNLTMPIEQARATAVLPTRTILDLARRAQAAGVLRKVDVVSTVGVWGRTPGVMPERALPDVGDFHNTYEAAKAEAERVLWAEAQALPVTVHRPSMVVGETGDGRVIHFQIFYHLCEFLSGRRTFGVMPPLGQTRLDTVPVDWVAQAIDWCSRHEETAGRIVHLCSGPEQAIELTTLRQVVRETWRGAGQRLPMIKPVDRRLLLGLVPLIGSLAGGKARRALRALPPVLAYLAEDQAFGNDRSAQMLAAAGLPLPPVRSYLDVILAYYLQQRAGRGRP